MQRSGHTHFRLSQTTPVETRIALLLFAQKRLANLHRKKTLEKNAYYFSFRAFSIA